jgi:hypothetical protein
MQPAFACLLFSHYRVLSIAMTFLIISNGGKEGSQNKNLSMCHDMKFMSMVSRLLPF